MCWPHTHHAFLHVCVCVCVNMREARVRRNRRALTHNDTHFTPVPVKADGEKQSQRSHISPDNSSLSRALRLKGRVLVMHHNAERHSPLTVSTVT